MSQTLSGATEEIKQRFKKAAGRGQPQAVASIKTSAKSLIPFSENL
jgi:hypothetical protein